ncbi:hypothetical protein VC83_02096 [Pseudogymnoascus destructans]|uniref:Uncharacterized protein n=2 Tax=Pseudogymnoascus destructans TaxID=655981 RepID=L8G6C3_PSED2|nr:uncharacterized protein VC83_02096 [Pseudogymnoascus destructans]ELR07521.1 hypothetical protein GMDG_02612 [Pseudogymnoascus destructans 20631-21]OAF61524.1 hypothetical protein VC83_02096 [Pseudogymnoascus destructans]
MTLFALPLSWQNGRISTSASSFPQTAGQSTNRKRKRSFPLNSPPPPSTLSTLPNSVFEFPSSPAPSANLDYVTSNPLSLNADETRQYRAAGLELDKELPSKTYTGFPHMNLPWEAGLTTDDEERQESKAELSAIERGSKPSHLKVRHLGVLTAILQRCLAEGDIPRASKAWALLLRAQVGGKGVDLRSTGYWSLGAELLIRRGEQLAANGRSHEDDIEETYPLDPQDSGVVSWGTAEGLERAKDYYARLILQHPYKRQYSTATSALDFWPAMLSCEIYGIQSKQQQSLHQLAMRQSDSNNGSASDHEDSLSDGDSDHSGDESLGATQEEVYFARRTKRESRAAQRHQLRSWKKKEEVRMHARSAAEKVATRIDEIMTTPPFVDSHVLHRLRGYLALYIGDLCILSSWEQKADSESERASAWVRRSEAERGELLKKEMIEVARAHFDVARRRGGHIPDWETEETTVGYEDESA